MKERKNKTHINLGNSNNDAEDWGPIVQILNQKQGKTTNIFVEQTNNLANNEFELGLNRQEEI